MLFYAREYLYSSTRRAMTKTVRSFARAPSASTVRAAAPGTDTQRSEDLSRPVRPKKTRFQTELAVSRTRASRESGMESLRRLVMYYLAPPQMVHFPEEKVKQASYSYRKSMHRPYQTSLQYKIQHGIHAIRPSSAHSPSSP